MADILVYALHDDEGVFNKNSLGAISEAAATCTTRSRRFQEPEW